MGFAAGRLASRDPEAGWALSRGAAQTLLALVTFLTMLAHPASGLLVPIPLVAGWLAARGGAHASDVAFLGVAGLVAIALAWHRRAWDDSPLFLVPALLVAAALLAREAWDLSLLRASVQAQRRAPAAGGDPPGPAPDPAARRALLAAALVLLAGLGLAWTLGLAREGVRDAYASLGAASVRNAALALFVAAVGGAVWALARGRRDGAGEPPAR